MGARFKWLQEFHERRGTQSQRGLIGQKGSFKELGSVSDKKRNCEKQIDRLNSLGFDWVRSTTWALVPAFFDVSG